MKNYKFFLKFTAPVCLLMLFLQASTVAQVTYSTVNTATATGTAPGSVQVTDISNNGLTVSRLDGDETPVVFPMVGLAKTASSSAVNADGSYNVTYTLMIQNYSTIDLNNIQVTDDLTATFPSPATFTVVGGSVVKLASNTTNGSGAINVNTSFNGTTNKNLLLPASSSLIGVPAPASGSSYYATIQFVVNVKPNGPFITYNNTATVTAKTVTSNPVDVSDISHYDTSPNQGSTSAGPLTYNTPTPVNFQASDIEVNKTVNPTTPDVNTQVTFIVKVKNNGPGVAAPVVVNDLLPAGYQYVSHAAPGSTTYDLATGVWTVGTLAVGNPSELSLSITAIVLPNKTAAEYTNIASSNHPGDPVSPNNTSTVNTVVPGQVADLQITNTDGKLIYVPGETNTYTIVVTNAGPSNVTAATVTNTLPTGVTGTWTAVYSTNTNGTATGAASGTGSISQSVNMPAGTTVTYTYIVSVPSGTTIAEFVNTVEVVPPTGITDPTPANNIAEDKDSRNSIADLQITNTDGKTAYVPGTTNTYTIVATNAGPTDVTGARVEYPLPTGITGSWTAVYSTNANGTASGTASGTGSISELVNLPAGTTVTYTFTANIPAAYQNDLIMPATVALPGGVTDPTPANNSAVDTDTQNVLADLKISNTDGKAAYTPGTTNTYTMVVSNDGPSNVAGALVTNTLPAAVTGTWTAVYAGGATGTASGTNSISQSVDMPTGSTVTYTYIVNVPSGTTGSFINTAAVAAPAGVTDPTPANNTATDTDSQSGLIDLAITETVDNTTPDVGSTVTFSFTARNNGPSDATGVKITDILPAGFTFVSAQPSIGTYSSTTGIWTMSGLATGASATLSLTVRVNANVPASAYVNPVTISGNETESTLTNNNDSKSVIPVPVIDLAIVKSVSNANPDAGSTISFTIAVSNTGPSNATGVLVNDLLQPGYSFVRANSLQGSYSNTTGVWSIGNLAAGSSATLTLSVYVNPTGPYDNTAKVTGAEKEINLDDNASGLTPPVNASPTIGLAKSAASVIKQLNGSYDITYVFTVGNYGLVDMDKIGITDDLSKTFPRQIVTVKSVRSLGNLRINPSFNGSTDIRLLEANTNKLAKGQIEKLDLLVNVLLVDNDGVFLNSAFAEGFSIAGLKAEDQSTDGVVPDPVTPGNVSPAAPTPVTLVRNKELIPEGFSPNGDGVNDQFVIENLGLNKINLEIYNRWGNLVYKNPDYRNDWDGTCNTGIYLGQNLPDGTYYYVAIIDGKERRVRFITINR